MKGGSSPSKISQSQSPKKDVNLKKSSQLESESQMDLMKQQQIANSGNFSDQILFSNGEENPQGRKKSEEIQFSNHIFDNTNHSSKMGLRKKNIPEEVVKDRQDDDYDAQEQQFKQYQIDPKQSKNNKQNGDIQQQEDNNFNEYQGNKKNQNLINGSSSPQKKELKTNLSNGNLSPQKFGSESPLKNGYESPQKNDNKFQGKDVQNGQQSQLVQRNSQDIEDNYDDKNEKDYRQSTIDSRERYNFSDKYDEEVQKEKNKKRKSKFRESISGLSAQEKALVEKMKLNKQGRENSASPLNTLIINRQSSEDYVRRGSSPNQSQQTQQLRKKSIFNNFQLNNSSNITPNQGSIDDKERRVSFLKLDKKDQLSGKFSVTESNTPQGSGEKSRKQSMHLGISKYALTDFRQRLNSIRKNSEQEESGLSESQGLNHINLNGQSDFEKEILQNQAQQSPLGTQSGTYMKIRDLLQQQLDQDGGIRNDEEGEEEEVVDLQEEMNMIEEELINQVDPQILEEYETLTQDMESRALSIYNKTYKAIKKTPLDQVSEMFFKKTYGYIIYKFFCQVQSSITHYCYKIVKSDWFENMILITIIFNSVMLMLDDPTTDVQSSFQDNVEEFFLWAYTAEAGLKIIAFGFVFPKGAYLKDGWNFLDFVIVATSLLPLIVGSSTINLRALRSLRILRPLRTISKVKKLKILLKTLFSAIPFLVNSMIILVFFFLIFAIGGLQLFGGLLLRRCMWADTGIILNDQLCGGEKGCGDGQVCGKTMNNPQYDVTSFDNIFYSFLMVFQVITMEGWTQIMFQVFDTFSIFASLYFILIVFIGSFFLLNLTLAVIKAKFSDNQTSTIEILQDEEEDMRIDILKEYRHLEREYMRNFNPLDDSSKNFGTKADDKDDYGNERGFVWEDLLKLRQLQKQKEIENKEKEDKLRKKLFVEQWRNNQRQKIQTASKRIAKLYKIVPAVPSLTYIENHQEQTKKDNTHQNTNNIHHHQNHQHNHPHGHGNNQENGISKNPNENKPNQIRKQSLFRLSSKEHNSIGYGSTGMNQKENVNKVHNKVELPLQRIIIHYNPTQNTNYSGISPITSQNGLVLQSTQNSLQGGSNYDNTALLPKTSITFMGIQSNSNSFMKPIYGQATQTSLRNIPMSSQQQIMNEDEEEQFWKEINGQKEGNDFHDGEKSEKQLTNSNVSSLTHIKRQSIQGTLHNNPRKQSIIAKNQQQYNNKNYAKSQSPSKENLHGILNSQNSETHINSKKSQPTDTQLHKEHQKEVIPESLLQEQKLSSKPPAQPTVFSIMNLKSKKTIANDRLNASPRRANRLNSKQSYNKFGSSISIQEDESIAIASSQNSFNENDHLHVQNKLSSQNSKSPLHIPLNGSGDTEENQQTNRVMESKSHINPNHQVLSPNNMNILNNNIQTFNDEKGQNGLQLDQENDKNTLNRLQSIDLLKSDRDYHQKQLVTEENLIKHASQNSLESPIIDISPSHQKQQRNKFDTSQSNLSFPILGQKEGNDFNSKDTLEYLVLQNKQIIQSKSAEKQDSKINQTQLNDQQQKATQKAEIKRQGTDELSENLLDDSDFFQDADKKKETAENFEYLASVLKNLNENIALRLKNEDEEQEDDYNLAKKSKVTIGQQIHITSKYGPPAPIPPTPPLPPPPAYGGKSPDEISVQHGNYINQQYIAQNNITPFEQYQDNGNQNYEENNHIIEEEEEEEDMDERSRVQSHLHHSSPSHRTSKKKITQTPRGNQSSRSQRISTDRSQKKKLTFTVHKSDDEQDEDEENNQDKEQRLKDYYLQKRIIKPKKISFVELIKNGSDIHPTPNSDARQRNSTQIQQNEFTPIMNGENKELVSVEQKENGLNLVGKEHQIFDPAKNREFIQMQWLSKIQKIKDEHQEIQASHSSQAMQFEIQQRRLREKEERDKEEKMIKEVKNWKLSVNENLNIEYSSQQDVMEQTIQKAERERQMEEEEKFKSMHFKILHKLKQMKKKTKKVKRVKKSGLSVSRIGSSRRSNENGSQSKDTIEQQKNNAMKMQKIRKLQQMYTNAAAAGSKKSGNLNQTSNNLQLGTPSVRKRQETNTQRDNKSVITFSKFAQGFRSPQVSTTGDRAANTSNMRFIQRNQSSYSQKSDNELDEKNRVKIPIKMSNRIMMFDHLSSHYGEEQSISELQSVSLSQQNNSLSSTPNRIVVSQTKRKRERIKQGLLQDQNVKNNEKIDFSNFISVQKEINAPIKKGHDDKAENLDNFNFKNDYVLQQREDVETGIKSKNIFSGVEILRGFKGGSLRLNKVLRVLNTDRQEIKMWMIGLMGILTVIHKHIRNFVIGGLFNNIATLCVFGNTLVLALDGSFTDEDTNNTLDKMNQIFSYIFIGEMAFKIIGLSPLGYVRDKMNIFDGLIVSLSIFELLFFSGGSKAISAFRAVRIFRTFRVLRVTRLLRGLEFMGKIVNVVKRTMDSFIYIALLLFLFIFIFSLLGMQLYGGNLKILDPRVRQNFDSFQNAFISVFQIMTMENWNDILYKAFNSSVNKFITTFYLIIWIFIGNWIFLNLFLAILLDGFTDQSAEDSQTLDELEDQYEEDELIDKTDKKEKNNQLNPENLQILNEDYDRMDSEEMEQLEQEILQLEGKSAHQELFVGIECSDSLFIFSKQNWFRRTCYQIVKHEQFENLILFFIVTSSLKLVVDTYVDEDSSLGIELKKVDLTFNFIFITECILKIVSYGFIGDENSYLDESWSQIDFFIVLTSIVDMSFDGINISFLKILRLLRTLRPLRFISHNVNMKVVVIALFESVSGILNVLIVIVLIWLMFAILGISLIGTRMGYCNGVVSVYEISKNMCLEMGKTWSTYDTNFDNILNAMRTLYIVSSLEGWPDIMYQAIDSNTDETGPKKDNYIIISYFFILFILVGSFFLVNLFVGVIFLNFNEAQKNEHQSSLFLTEEQKRWIEFQQMIIGVKAEFSQSSIPTKPFPRLMYNIATNNKFEIFIMILIVSNIITMGMVYEGSSSGYNTILEDINLFFTICFIIELVMKMIAFGLSGFWANGWNKFDLFVVVSSIMDIVLNVSGALSASFLRIGPQLIRIIRVFRVSRLLKLVKSMQGLQKLIETLLFSLPSLINVGALLLLVFFIYSILGVFLFKDVTQGSVIDNYNNFSNFGFAMLTLFRCSTGENWYQFMFDCGKTTNCTYGVDCGSPFSSLYFVTFVLICSFIMLNLFILIIIQYFEDYHMKDDNPLQAFNDKLEIFRITWSKYTKKTLGEKINAKEIVDFLYELPLPLGYFDPDPSAPTAHPTTKKEIAKQVMNWALTQQVADDQEGYIFFNDLLFACMRKEYGAKLMQNAGPEMLKMLNKLEVETRLKIAEKKKKQILKKNKKMFGAHSKNSKKVNPMMAFMFLQMAFKAWNHYSENNKDDNGEVKHNDQESSESSSCYSESQLEDGDEEQSPQDDQEQNSFINNSNKPNENKQRYSLNSNMIKNDQLIEHDDNKEASRKSTLLSKLYPQQYRQSVPQVSSQYASQIQKNTQQDQQDSSSSSNSDSDSSSDSSSSSSEEERAASRAYSKKDGQKSKKNEKSIYDAISEKADEDFSPAVKKQLHKPQQIRRIGTLNIQKSENQNEFGQTNNYQYIKKENTQISATASRQGARKSSYIGVEVSKNSIFNQKNPLNNRLSKQASLKIN